MNWVRPATLRSSRAIRSSVIRARPWASFWALFWLAVRSYAFSGRNVAVRTMVSSDIATSNSTTRHPALLPNEPHRVTGPSSVDSASLVSTEVIQYLCWTPPVLRST